MKIWYISRLGRTDLFGGVLMTPRLVSRIERLLKGFREMQHIHPTVSMVLHDDIQTVSMLRFRNLPGAVDPELLEPGVGFFARPEDIRHLRACGRLTGHPAVVAAACQWHVTYEIDREPVTTGWVPWSELQSIRLLRAEDHEIRGLFRRVARRAPVTAIAMLMGGVGLEGGLIPKRSVAQFLTGSDLMGLLESDVPHVREAAIALLGVVGDPR